VCVFILSHTPKWTLEPVSEFNFITSIILYASCENIHDDKWQ